MSGWLPDIVVEAGFGYTWADGQSIDWTDITEWVQSDSGIQVSRGRSTEFDRMNPGRCSFGLVNNDRRFDPLHDDGPHYGNLVPGVPVRVRLAEAIADPYVFLNGSAYLETPDDDDLDLTGDIDIRVRVAADKWVSGAWQTILSKGATIGGQQYNLDLQPDGALVFWVGGIGDVWSGITDYVTNGEALWFRCTFDQDNGSGESVRRYYTSADGSSWTLRETDADSTQQTPVTNSHALRIGVGSFASLPFDPHDDPFKGKIYNVQVRDGIGGTVVANFDAEDSEGSFPYTDSAGRVWSNTGGQFFDFDATKVLFTGYVVEWPQQYEVDGMMSVPIEALDLLSLAGRLETPGSVLEATILGLEPTHYWPLTEDVGSTVEDVAGEADGTLRRAIAEQGSQVTPFDARPSLRVSTPQGLDRTGQGAEFAGVGLVPDTATPSQEFTVSMWAHAQPGSLTIDGVNYPQPNVASIWVSQASKGPKPLGTEELFWIGFGTHLLIPINDGTEQGMASTYSGTDLPFVPHLVTVTVDASSGTVIAYIDGQAVPWYQSDPDNPVDPFEDVDIPTALAALANSYIGWGVTYSNDDDFSETDDFDNGHADLSHVALWDRVLTPAEIASIYAASVAPWDGDRTGARVDRLAGLLGDATATDADPDGVTLGPASLNGNLADLLAQVATAENGRIFVDGRGVIRLRTRYANVDVDPLVTITDDGDGDYSAVSINAPAAHLINRVEVNGTRLDDDDSIAAYGIHGRTLDVPLLPSVQRRRDLGRFVLANNAEPRARVYGLTLPIIDDDDATTLLALDIGDRVDFSRNPRGVGDPIELEQVVEGIDISISNDGASISLYISPADTVSWWQWGVSEWGVDNRPGY